MSASKSSSSWPSPGTTRRNSSVRVACRRSADMAALSGVVELGLVGDPDQGPAGLPLCGQQGGGRAEGLAGDDDARELFVPFQGGAGGGRLGLDGRDVRRVVRRRDDGDEVGVVRAEQDARRDRRAALEELL